MRAGPLPAALVRRVFDRLGGPGYGLLGEALLVRVGLGSLYETERRGAHPRSPRARGSRLRGLVRDWLARQIDVRLEAA